jgi:hypothetical protein
MKAQSAKTSTTTTTETATDANAPNFATILSKLSSNVNAASMKTQTGDVNSFLNTDDTSASLNIDAIVQQVITAKKNGSTLSTDSLIKQYLLKKFGGSEEEVIKKLAGVQSMPTQFAALQNLAFNNIVSKISTQVRSKINSLPENDETTISNTDLSSSLETDSSSGLSSDTPFM